MSEDAFYTCSTCEFTFACEERPSFCPGCGLEISDHRKQGSADSYGEAKEKATRPHLSLAPEPPDA